MPLKKEALTILVEGIGHVVQTKYVFALKIQYDNAIACGKNLRVIFTDDRRYWTRAKTRKKNEKFVKELEEWADFLDKGEPSDAEKYNSLKPDVVLIATPDSTHTLLALDWLQRKDACKHVFIEKPLDCSLSRARTLCYYAKSRPDITFYAIDHYLPRLLPLREERPWEELIERLGKRITKITFYLLEDRSVPFKGPIESAFRSPSLEHGLILDLLPHALAILNHLGRIESIELNELKVAQYTFEDKSGNTKTTTPKETYAEIDFAFELFSGHVIDTKVYLGKGISGSKDAPIEGSEVKCLELTGLDGARCVIDLSTGNAEDSGSVLYYKGRDSLPPGPQLHAVPYAILIKQIVDKFLFDEDITFDFHLDLEDAKNLLACIHEMMTLVENFLSTSKSLTKYHIKTIVDDNGKPKSYPPTLEQIRASLGHVHEEVLIADLTKNYRTKKGKRSSKDGRFPH